MNCHVFLVAPSRRKPDVPKKDVVLIAVALVCAVGGVFLVHSYIDRVTGEYRSKLDNIVRVIAITKPMRKGDVITKEHITTKEVPVMFLPPKVVEYSEATVAEIINRPVSAVLEADSILLWYNLDTELHSSIADVLERGQKAVTLPVDSITGMSGLLKPKIRIDLYAIFEESSISGQEEQGRSRSLAALRLFENVLLVAVGDKWTDGPKATQRALGFEDEGYSTVTVMVEEKDVERVLLAQELTRRQGTRIFCVLRSEMDAGAEKKDLPPVTQKEFFSSLPKQDALDAGSRNRR